MEEKNGFLKFQKNRRVQSRDIMRYVRKSPLGGALDREMYILTNYPRQLDHLDVVDNHVTTSRQELCMAPSAPPGLGHTYTCVTSRCY